ncbi:GPW/gp25 family protein [Enterobacter asburiae]|uniref:type VI secretion system baseplate subunit TssE n=1 Tax=unclassified Scandinavium TaxID=2830652 RepID=UPI00289CFDC2|nr:GPW/gp25 family protein [Scandinavium sp.]
MNSKQQYLPTLLDRLLDDEPKKQQEAFDKAFYDARTLRRLVQRDLASLLNCNNIDRELDPVKHCHVANTVVNFGITPLPGMPVNLNNWRQMEKNIRDAILRFEPRIIPESLLVHILHEKDKSFSSTNMLFEVRGLIYWEPHPIDLCLNGSYDRECERIELSGVS